MTRKYQLHNLPCWLLVLVGVAPGHSLAGLAGVQRLGVEVDPAPLADLPGFRLPPSADREARRDCALLRVVAPEVRAQPVELRLRDVAAFMRG